MILRNQIFIISISFFLSILFMGSFIGGIAEYKLKKNDYRQRKKWQTFLQRIRFVNFRDTIPKGWLVFYTALYLLHITAIVVCLFLFAIDIELSHKIGRIIAVGIEHFFLTWLFAICTLFFQFGYRKKGFKYERWFNKKSK